MKKEKQLKQNKTEILVNISWNGNQKRAGVTILILNKINFNPKIATKDKEDLLKGQFIKNVTNPST